MKRRPGDTGRVGAKNDRVTLLHPSNGLGPSVWACRTLYAAADGEIMEATRHYEEKDIRFDVPESAFPPEEDGVVWASDDGHMEIRVRWIGGAVDVELWRTGAKVHSHICPGDSGHYVPTLGCVKRVARERYDADC